LFLLKAIFVPRNSLFGKPFSKLSGVCLPLEKLVNGKYFPVNEKHFPVNEKHFLVKEKFGLVYRKVFSFLAVFVFRETIFQTFLCLFVIRKVDQRKTLFDQ
jgi:hypothetical protein